MLEAIATDLDTFQSAADQDQKAKGKAPRRATETPRRGSRWTSGSQRLHDEPVVKRVPGASRKRTAAVDRSLPLPDRTNLVDIMRFNEAIDQATAETTARFARELRHSHDLFLAILGHDGGIAVPWFTIHRSSAEALNVADNVRANYATCLERPHWPRGTAAAFLRYDHPTGQMHFYFSPAFAEAEPFMVQLYDAGVCSPPKRHVGFALLVGQFEAMELLAD